MGFLKGKPYIFGKSESGAGFFEVQRFQRDYVIDQRDWNRGQNRKNERNEELEDSEKQKTIETIQEWLNGKKEYIQSLHKAIKVVHVLTHIPVDVLETQKTITQLMEYMHAYTPEKELKDMTLEEKYDKLKVPPKHRMNTSNTKKTKSS